MRNVKLLFVGVAAALGSLLVLPGQVLASSNSPADVESVHAFAEHYANEISHKAQVSHNSKEFINYLREVAPKIISFNYMSLWIIGTNRTHFSPEQLREFSSAFTENLINFYGTLVYQNKDKPIHLTNVQEDGKNLYSVSFLVNLNQQDINLDWRVRYSEKKNSYFITDVMVNGISFLQSKRLEYNTLFNQCGKDPDKFIAAVKNHPVAKR